MERLLAGGYRAIWGLVVRKKSERSGAKWVNPACSWHDNCKLIQGVTDITIAVNPMHNWHDNCRLIQGITDITNMTTAAPNLWRWSGVWCHRWPNQVTVHPSSSELRLHCLCVLLSGLQDEPHLLRKQKCQWASCWNEWNWLRVEGNRIAYSILLLVSYYHFSINVSRVAILNPCHTTSQSFYQFSDNV